MPTASIRRRPIAIFAAAILLALVVAGGYGLWYVFLRPDGPAAVSASNLAVPSTVSSADPSLTADGIGGTWTVDTSVGSFSDFSGSFVGYRVQEQLAGIGGNIAVGRTPGVSGSMVIDGATVTSVDITADLSTLQSDDERRDGQLRQQSLETIRFPTATFTLTQPFELPDGAATGAQVSVTATGDLTIHGATQSVEIVLTGRLAGDTIGLTGSMDVSFADYGISKPQSFAVLTVDDHATIELQLFFSRS